MPTNEAEVPPQLWILRADIEDDCLAGASLFTEKPRGESVEYVPASALSEVWVAFQALFDMVNCALDSRDALLISKTSATMLKAGNLLAARDAALSAGKGEQ